MSVLQKNAFSGGLNDSKNLMDVRTNQLTDVSNMIPDKKSRSLVKRAGFGNLPITQSLSDRCTGLGQLRTRDQGSFKIGLFGDGKAYLLAQNAWTAVSGATGLNTSSPWDMTWTEIGGFDALVLSNFEDVPKTWAIAAASTLMEGCEDKNNWSKTGTVSLSNIPGLKTQGNQSVGITQAGGVDTISVYQALGSTSNGTGKDVWVDWYSNQPVSVFDATNAVTIYVGIDSDNYYKKTYARADLSDGTWMTLGGALPADFTMVGSPVITALNYLKIEATRASGAADIIMFMDNWRLTLAGGNVPAWQSLGGTPPRVKYLVYFMGYLWGLNGKDNNDDTLLYPHLAYRADTLLQPATMTGNNSYNFYDEITGAAIANNVLVVFTKSGIHEVSYTANAGIPFIKKQTNSAFGAFHRTVRSTGKMVVFAYYGGVYGYVPGTGQIIQLGGQNINNTYAAEVENAGKNDGLYSTYVSSSRQYMLAVGSGSANDKLLVYEVDFNAWYPYTSDITGFDVSAMASVRDGDDVVVPWLGLATGQVVTYGEHTATYTDQNQDGTDIDVAALLATDALDWNNPHILKRLLSGNIKGKQASASNITLKVYPDERATGVTLGTFDLATTDSWVSKRYRVSSAAGRGYAFVLELSETGGASADTRWRIDHIGYEADMLGMR